MMLLCLLILTTVAGSALANFRLPTSIAPLHYWLRLKPSLTGDFLTTGEVRVLLNCTESTNEVIFNLNSIHVNTVKLEHEAGHQLQILQQENIAEEEKYRLRVGSPLNIGEKYNLFINFSYQLNNNLEGFYRSSYTDSFGKTRWLATTQFSPINARRAFPCWDEPSFKAVFNITLGRPANMTSISNMPTFLTTPMEDMEDWVWDHHESTLPMSTYLVAFIVTDLPSKDLNTTSNPHFKVWSRPELLDEMDYVGRISPKILSYIADFFRIPFPLQKIDLFAVPDFGFSAMENWGMITFAESAIKASKTIAHELAHQWFGNLVTPEWWEDLWLKEGFATFIGIIALDKVEGNSNETDKWIVSELHHSMFEDSLVASHPVSNPVDDPRKIWQAFDAISYEKGSSIVRMMWDFLGEEEFRRGLNKYLKKFAFKNARREQLWGCFDGVADLPQVMDLWTLQTGYPVLSVYRDYPSGNISISQGRFLLNGSRDENSIWHIPYRHMARSMRGENRDVSWLNTQRIVRRFEGLAQSDWLLIGVNRTGYYRVNYDKKNWAMLIEGFESLPRLSKIQLINDAFNLAIPGSVEYSVPFGLAERLFNSTDKLLWNVTSVELGNIGLLLRGTPLHGDYKVYCLSLFPSENLSYQSEDKMLVNLASSLGHKNLIRESIEAMQNLMQGKHISFVSEVLGAVYCNGVKYSGQEVWDFLWSKYLVEKKPEEKRRIMSALACSSDRGNLKLLLEAVMQDDSGLRKQDAKFVFSRVAVSELGADLSLDFLINNWYRIKRRFGLGYKIMSTMILSLGPVLNQQSQLDRVMNMYRDHLDDLGSASNAFLNTLERTEINIKWHVKHYLTVQNIVKNKIIK